MDVRTNDTDMQGANNNNPMKQPVDVESMQKTDPAKSWPDTQRDPNGPKGPHPVVGNEAYNADSGKDIGLFHAPITSINPTTNSTLDSEKGVDNIVKVSKPNRYVNQAEQTFAYPFEETAFGEGFFVPLEAGQTTDSLMAKLDKQIYQFQQMTGECEKDVNGDDVWESVVIQTKKRRDNVIELDSFGKPIVGANQTNRPKLIHSANFITRPVIKGDDLGEGTNAETDGVLVIRVL